MSKVNTIDLTSPSYNAEREVIQNKFNELVSFLNDKVAIRDDTGIEAEPKQMENVLDMNSNEVLNLPFPETDLEPVRKKDFAALAANLIIGADELFEHIKVYPTKAELTAETEAYASMVAVTLGEATVLDGLHRMWVFQDGLGTGPDIITTAGGEKCRWIPEDERKAEYVALEGLLLDTGSANNYTLTPPTGYQPVKTLVDGMRFRFVPTNNNTSGTVNITYAGTTKSAVNQDGGTLIADEINTARECIIEFDSGGDRWLVTNSGEEWRALSLENSWVNFGSGWPDASVKKSGNTISVRGLLKDGTTTNGTKVCTLPANFRPAYKMMVPQVHNVATAHRIDIDFNGDIFIHGVTSSTFMAFNFTFLEK